MMLKYFIIFVILTIVVDAKFYQKRTPEVQNEEMQKQNLVKYIFAKLFSPKFSDW